MGGMETIDDRFTPLLARARTVLADDPRVLTVAVGGSVGAGTADRWSDLDLQIVADESGYDSFLADWPAWLPEITPTVFARTPIAPFVINTVTDEGLTLDLAVYQGAPFELPTPTGYAVGLLSASRFDDVGAALEYAVAEQLRGLVGPFISLIQRDEHFRHLTGMAHLVGLLTTVFLAELDAPPLGKHWNRTFTEEQRAAVAALPPVAATREAVLAFGLESARLLITRARPELARRGIDWPAPLAAVAADRINDVFEIDTHDWLY
jgi:hypothetical protein